MSKSFRFKKVSCNSSRSYAIIGLSKATKTPFLSPGHCQNNFLNYPLNTLLLDMVNWASNITSVTSIVLHSLSFMGTSTDAKQVTLMANFSLSIEVTFPWIAWDCAVVVFKKVGLFFSQFLHFHSSQAYPFCPHVPQPPESGLEGGLFNVFVSLRHSPQAEDFLKIYLFLLLLFGFALLLIWFPDQDHYQS